MGLLSSSADQSAIMHQMENQANPDMDEGIDDSCIIHNGKKYSRIQIEDLGEDEYLMDENGDIFTLDFKFIINMGDNVDVV